MQSFYDVRGIWQSLPDDAVNGLPTAEYYAYLHGYYGAQAVERARAEFAVDLDYSRASVVMLEDILRRLRRRLNITTRAYDRGEIAEEFVTQAAQPWGAYLAEVLRLRLGASYLDPQAHDGYTMLCCGLNCLPTSKVFKRLVDGPADDVAFYVAALEEHGRTRAAR